MLPDDVGLGERATTADAAAENLQAFDLAAKLAVIAVALHGAVEIADGDRPGAIRHRTCVVGGSLVQLERGLACRLIRRSIEQTKGVRPL